jgi:uncharacterized membrane protein YphA (DoxX/SURF4 family)
MDALLLARTLVCAFFTVLFLQSGLDKVVDWKGNLDWLTGHFSKSFFGKATPVLLGTMAVMELLTCLASAFAIVVLWTSGPPEVPIAAMTLACLSLVMLFAGQRFAKDYAGAATLATYFAVSLLGLALMHPWPHAG